MLATLIPLVGFVLALAITILAFVFIVPEKKRPKLNGFGKFLHDLCNFKFLIVEKIFQFCYILATAYCLIGGFLMLFQVEEVYHWNYNSSYTTTEWVGYRGLIIMILGPIFVRIGYELMMLVIIAIKNIIQINNKLKNQNEDAQEKAPVAPVAPTAPVKPVAPVVPVEPVAPAEPVFPVPPVEPVAPAEPVAEPQQNVCPNCGAPKKPDEFCAMCGHK